jgi:hypothetical protein
MHRGHQTLLRAAAVATIAVGSLGAKTANAEAAPYSCDTVICAYACYDVFCYGCGDGINSQCIVSWCEYDEQLYPIVSFCGYDTRP